MIFTYNTAKKNFFETKIQGCKKFFETNKYTLEQAYCEIIYDNLTKAEELFNQIKDKDLRAHWGLIVINFLRGNVIDYPSYFEIRAFLELDLNILMLYGKGDYVEKIVRYADFMFMINPEVNKFIGRALLNHNYKPQAMFFLQRAKDKFYQDPELHYILGQIYYAENNFELCKKALTTCLQILPEYMPADTLLKKLQ